MIVQFGPLFLNNILISQFNFADNYLTTEDFAQGLTILADGSLRLASALISDEGVYTCVASNDAGQSKKSIRLIVQGQ